MPFPAAMIVAFSIGALLAGSPYHPRQRDACHPAVLITPSDVDETAVPAHGCGSENDESRVSRWQ